MAASEITRKSATANSVDAINFPVLFILSAKINGTFLLNQFLALQKILRNLFCFIIRFYGFEQLRIGIVRESTCKLIEQLRQSRIIRQGICSQDRSVLRGNAKRVKPGEIKVFAVLTLY